MFHLFPLLPTELRQQIWYEHLSHLDDRPAVFLYSRDLFPLWPSRPPLVQLPTAPTLHVDSEARATTLSWARGRNVRLTYRAETRGHILTRPFDPARDYMYVPRSEWEDFTELSEGAFEQLGIVHLALPAFTSYYSYMEVMYLMCLCPRLRSLVSVWGKAPHLKYAAAGTVTWAMLDMDDDEDDEDEEDEEEDDDDEDEDEDGEDESDQADEREAADTEEPGTKRRKKTRNPPEDDDDICNLKFSAHVQPRWELEDEHGPLTSMCILDPVDGSVTLEEAELEMWMSEMEEALLTTELPEHVYDVDEEKFLIDMRAVKAVLRD